MRSSGRRLVGRPRTTQDGWCEKFSSESLCATVRKIAPRHSELVDLLSTGRDHYDAQISAIDTYNTLKQTEYQAAQSIGVLGSLVVRSGGGKRAP